MNEYYVYVYIDPRNLEQFYYGKGMGSRKNSHLSDTSESNMAKRIKEIWESGVEPIIKVIAANLTEEEALLIETTLIWKLGKFTENIKRGQFSKKFRPLNSLHLDLSNFDYQNGIYYYNVGEGPHRNWDDYVKYGFISAGQKKIYGYPMLKFKKGDVIAAYFTGKGFVGIGKILEPGKRINEVVIKGTKLLDLELSCKNMGKNSNSIEKSEYVAIVEWIKVVSREYAIWKRNSGIFTTTHIRASLDRQQETIDYLEKEFEIDIRALVV